MRVNAFASRNQKELLRDPMSLLFGIGLPVVLLLLISTLQKSIQVEIFQIENFAPGIAMFSLSFITLFSGMLIARDRSSSFLTRLFASPLSALDYIAGYSLPLLPIALLQSSACLTAAFLLGLPFDVNALLAILVLIPVAMLFIGFGLLLGSIFTDQQVGAISSILVQIVALSSGMWFDLNMMGGTLKTICYALPFAHAVDATRAAFAGDVASVLPNLWWVLGYSVAIFTLAVLAFRRNMKS